MQILEVRFVARRKIGLRRCSSLFRHLDLDHLGAPVRELTDTGGASADARQIKHSDIVEGGGRRSVIHERALGFAGATCGKVNLHSCIGLPCFRKASSHAFPRLTPLRGANRLPGIGG